MGLERVPYTKQRGGRYHLNSPIPASIRPEYGGKVAFEKSTGSSDSEEAKRQVTNQRAYMNTQVK